MSILGDGSELVCAPNPHLTQHKSQRVLHILDPIEPGMRFKFLAWFCLLYLLRNPPINSMHEINMIHKSPLISHFCIILPLLGSESYQGHAMIQGQNDGPSLRGEQNRIKRACNIIFHGGFDGRYFAYHVGTAHGFLYIYIQFALLLVTATLRIYL